MSGLWDWQAGSEGSRGYVGVHIGVILGEYGGIFWVILGYILGLYWDYIEGSGFRVQAELYPRRSPRNPLVWSLSYKKSCISRLHKHGVSTVLVTHTPRS